eukprot:COSAG01_NODE_398_length_17547_cov_206.793501_15_plen_435_part_00
MSTLTNNKLNKILIIGSGGREHAIGHCIKRQNPEVSLYFAKGNAGTAQLGQNLDIDELNFESLSAFVKSNNIDLTFVGPEAPLVAGIVNFFQKHNLAIVGPSAEAAQLEGSKEWAKEFMKRYHIPSANYKSFDQYEAAMAHIKSNKTYPIVIKADGLAAGKGVSVCEDEKAASLALQDCFLHHKFKKAGQKVVIESFLKGEEASIFAFTDGQTFLPMLPSQDHKRIFDGDLGDNTGGMGAYCPAPIVNDTRFKQVCTKIFTPLVEGFKKERLHYTGIIYAGLMIDGDDINVVEFNVRFGDPETQVVLPLLKTSLSQLFLAMQASKLHDYDLEWDDAAATCVVLASKGYPASAEKNKVIAGLDKLQNPKQTHVIHAGTKSNSNKEILSNGGRVLAVVSKAKTLSSATQACYLGVDSLSFDGMQYRSDIAQKALKT